ncbi:phosphoribosylformimino-5-aminoimidazole carboxamide ribotide isomerase [Methanosalsum zhilinae DSM 4017]|uniref:1-(5-phosphoribosyl)-5-[(5-phosphoribosylamino)methylideneamino] imidazole-4-carboxamide isomerase n=1 Tax=Methanosalsum zhilinae (strain DSM 4017 / NBRC 107636 / OCM 62 / WeN5) TaxID=679901 RepID=F7XMV6_METZD|nr:1-(5-phosphoribosyl)-5-[(5-phosphoribosylamino)methylideneamino]imidazole-4-carboxamide isomerase [Methanosalsum zhilinae]AEH59973.1 phosphoribosylformimino-5-aminoimidazole carboxamide ribotide isomerase [Methanosalsum zhilinae DSM 4017]
MVFEVIPAVDMRNGKCVQLVQGVPGSEMISLDDPGEVASGWVEQGAATLHLIDLDGAIEGVRKNAPIIEKIIHDLHPAGVSVQVGGGIRSFEDAGKLLDLGTDRIILSTAALNDPQLVKRLAEEYGGERVMVALDAKDGKVSIEGWKKQSEHTPVELGVKFESLGAGSLLFTNIDSEGLMKGIDVQPTAELVSSVNIPVVASGGVTTVEDIISLSKVGASGVVVGSALYTGKFTFQDALEAIKQNP